MHENHNSLEIEKSCFRDNKEMKDVEISEKQLIRQKMCPKSGKGDTC